MCICVNNCGSENETGDQPEEVMTHAESTNQIEKLVTYLANGNHIDQSNGSEMPT